MATFATESRAAASAGHGAAEINQLRARDWQSYVDGRIAKALAEHDAIRREATAQFVAEVRKQLREEISAEVGKLRAELTVQRAAERNDVIDLPLQWPPRKARNAA